MFRRHKMNNEIKNHLPESKTGRMALCASMIALSMIFGYVESLIPIAVPIPGIKPGIANIVTVVCFYLFGKRMAWTVALVRIILMGLLFGNGYSFAFSMAGGCLSLICMTLGMKAKVFSETGVSVIGGVSHNVGQIVAAAILMNAALVLAEIPLLVVGGVICGLLIGLLSALIIRKMKAVNIGNI